MKLGKKNKSDMLIGDDGVIQKPDSMSRIVMAVSNILIAILIVLGIMAYVA